MSASATKRSLPLLPVLNEETIAGAVFEALAKNLDEGAPAARSADDAFAYYEEALRQVEARIPPAERACRDGCAYCCHLKVIVTPAEALRLGRALRAKLGAEELATLLGAARATNETTRGLDASARAEARLPCPLLDETNRCVGYEGRPVACAGANSYDRELCRAAFESSEDVAVPHYALGPRVAGAARAGASGALFRARLDGRILELVAALEIVLSDPEAEAKWARGEPVFDSAVDAEFERLVARAP